jgi:hypothetical protein
VVRTSFGSQSLAGGNSQRTASALYRGLFFVRARDVLRCQLRSVPERREEGRRPGRHAACQTTPPAADVSGSPEQHFADLVAGQRALPQQRRDHFGNGALRPWRAHQGTGAVAGALEFRGEAQRPDMLAQVSLAISKSKRSPSSPRGGGPK